MALAVGLVGMKGSPSWRPWMFYPHYPQKPSLAIKPPSPKSRVPPLHPQAPQITIRRANPLLPSFQSNAPPPPLPLPPKRLMNPPCRKTEYGGKDTPDLLPEPCVPSVLPQQRRVADILRHLRTLRPRVTASPITLLELPGQLGTPKRHRSVSPAPVSSNQVASESSACQPSRRCVFWRDAGLDTWVASTSTPMRCAHSTLPARMHTKKGPLLPFPGVNTHVLQPLAPRSSP